MSVARGTCILSLLHGQHAKSVAMKTVHAHIMHTPGPCSYALETVTGMHTPGPGIAMTPLGPSIVMHCYDTLAQALL